MDGIRFGTYIYIYIYYLLFGAVFRDGNITKLTFHVCVCVCIVGSRNQDVKRGVT